MELARYWNIVKRGWWIILITVGIGMGITAYVNREQVVEYESAATLLLNPSVPNSLVPYVRSEAAASLADSYTALMQTRSFAESVVKKLPFEMSAGRVTEVLKTGLTSNTLFYKLSARMESPEKAQQLLSTVLEVFLADNSARQATSNQNTGDTVTQMQQRLEAKLKNLSEQIASYEEEIRALEAQTPSPTRNTELSTLRDQLINLQDIETNTILAVAQLGGDTTQPDSALVIDEPLPGRLVKTEPLRNWVLGLVVSLMAGIGLVFLLDYLDHSVRSPDHVARLLGATPAATIGTVRRPRRGFQLSRRRMQGDIPKWSLNHRLVVMNNPGAPEAESFRILRTNIQFSGTEKPIRSIVVTSAGIGEGKTLIACNLAVAMAQAGKRVLLVDSDLRRPGIHDFFSLPNNTGFSSLAEADMAVTAGVVQRLAGLSNLAIITSGPALSNPSELLNSQRVSYLMELFEKQADLVIYDTPPASAVADPMILAANADAVLLVMQAGRTQTDQALRVIRSLQNVGARTLLPVLNRAKANDLWSTHYTYRTGTEATPTNGHHPKLGKELVAHPASKPNGHSSDS
jgi:non-specific protein-tyrosine kinase